MNIIFRPDHETPALIEATSVYQKIWNEDGQKILTTFQSITNLTFIEQNINAIVLEAKSHSYPLSLRASYSHDTKKATLVHELGHRLLIGNNIKGRNSLESHKQLNLFLFDVWIELYGIDFAHTQANIEKTRSTMYTEAWEWFENIPQEQRKTLFKSLKSSGKLE